MKFRAILFAVFCISIAASRSAASTSSSSQEPSGSRTSVVNKEKAVDFVPADNAISGIEPNPTAPRVGYAPSTLGERFETAVWGPSSGARQLIDYAQKERAEGKGVFGMLTPEPNVDIKTLKTRYQGVMGIDAPMPDAVARNMQREQADAQERQNILARWPAGFWNAILGSAADALATLLDPLVIAAWLIAGLVGRTWRSTFVAGALAGTVMAGFTTLLAGSSAPASGNISSDELGRTLTIIGVCVVGAFIPHAVGRPWREHLPPFGNAVATAARKLLARTTSWLPEERLCFATGCAGALVTLLSVAVLELSQGEIFWSLAFQIPMGISAASFAAFLLFRAAWLPLRRWIKEG